MSTWLPTRSRVVLAALIGIALPLFAFAYQVYRTSPAEVFDVVPLEGKSIALLRRVYGDYAQGRIDIVEWDWRSGKSRQINSLWTGVSEHFADSQHLITTSVDNRSLIVRELQSLRPIVTIPIPPRSQFGRPFGISRNGKFAAVQFHSQGTLAIVDLATGATTDTRSYDMGTRSHRAAIPSHVVEVSAGFIENDAMVPCEFETGSLNKIAPQTRNIVRFYSPELGLQAEHPVKDRGLYLYHPLTKSGSQVLHQHAVEVYAVSPGGARFVARVNQGVASFDSHSGVQQVCYYSSNRRPKAVAFSPSGDQLALASADELLMFETETGQLIGEYHVSRSSHLVWQSLASIGLVAWCFAWLSYAIRLESIVKLTSCITIPVMVSGFAMLGIWIAGVHLPIIRIVPYYVLTVTGVILCITMADNWVRGASLATLIVTVATWVNQWFSRSFGFDESVAIMVSWPSCAILMGCLIVGRAFRTRLVKPDPVPRTSRRFQFRLADIFYMTLAVATVILTIQSLRSPQRYEVDFAAKVIAVTPITTIMLLCATLVEAPKRSRRTLIALVLVSTIPIGIYLESWECFGFSILAATYLTGLFTCWRNRGYRLVSPSPSIFAVSTAPQVQGN